MKVFQKPPSAEYVEYRRGEDVSLVNSLNSLATLKKRLEEFKVLKLYDSLLLCGVNQLNLKRWNDDSLEGD